MKKIALAVMAVLLFVVSRSQNVGVGTSSPDVSAALDVSSSTKGTLITRMTTAQRKAIGNPAAGLLVYDLDKKTIYMWEGRMWMPFLVSANEKKLPPIAVGPDPGNPDMSFGQSICINGDYAIIGAPWAVINGNHNQGCAYIFQKIAGSWIQKAMLVSNNGSAEDQFGYSVSLNGEYAAIGAYGRTSDKGIAFVFHRSGETWIQEARFSDPDGQEGDQFGYSVAIDGNYIVVGAWSNDINSNIDQGNAFVFYRGSGWINNQAPQAELNLSNPDPFAQFGSSVSIEGDFIIIGAPRDKINGVTNQGSATIFGRNGTNWTQLHKLTASDGEESDNFGKSVSISGAYAAVGAPHNQDEKGAMYIYHPLSNNWNTGTLYQQSKYISLPGAVTHEGLGSSVCAKDDKFLAGTFNSKTVYLIDYSGGYLSLLRTIQEESGLEYGLYFGQHVAMDGFDIAISANRKVFFLNIE